MAAISEKQQTQLVELASRAQARAYAPYSGFKVGAAILADSGIMTSGCNVENAAYPLGQCAEATAIGSMVCDGGHRIAHLVIVSPNDEFCYPCGGCRQKINEFASADTVIELVNQRGEHKLVSMDELLPFAFSLDT